MIFQTFSEGIRIFRTTVKIKSIDDLISIEDVVEVEGFHMLVEYSYSIDGKIFHEAFSTLTDLTDALKNDQNLVILNDFEIYLSFQYTIDRTMSAMQSIFQLIDIKLTFADESIQQLRNFDVSLGHKLEQTIVRTSTPNILNPYKYNENAKRLYEELSIGINEMFGFDVIYFRTESSTEHKSMLFKVYELNNVVEVRKLKLSLKDNEIPEALEKFDEFGFDFQNELVVHIVKSEFARAFGTNIRPNSNDFIYLPLTDKMYQLNSPYDPKTFMQFAPYWEVMTTKYEKRSSVIDQNINDFHKIDDMIDFTEDYLELDEKFEVDDAIKDFNNFEQEKDLSSKHEVSKSAPNIAKMSENIYTFSTVNVDKNVVAKSYDFYQTYDNQLLITMWLGMNSSTEKIFTLKNSDESIELHQTTTGINIIIPSQPDKTIQFIKHSGFVGFVMLIDSTTFELSALLVDQNRKILQSETINIMSFANKFNAIQFFGQLKYGMIRGCKNISKYSYEELLFDNLLPTKKDFVFIKNATPTLNIQP